MSIDSENDKVPPITERVAVGETTFDENEIMTLAIRFMHEEEKKYHTMQSKINR